MKHAARLRCLALALLLAGCASTPSHPQDPLEPMNRAIYGFNTHVDRAVFKPVAETYRDVVPSPLRAAVGNFFDNLRDVISLANNTLQVRPEPALNDLMRVGLNSTLGFFGLLDIADPAGLKSYKTGFGDTLARWGWKDSTYLVLPFFGPSSIRDGIGRVADTATVPPHLVYVNETQATAGFALDFVDRRVRLLGIETTVEEAALDPYAYTRDAYIQLREHQLGQPHSVDPNSGDDVKIDELVNDDSAKPAGGDASAPAAAKPEASAPK
jgi:phospholipid-binding lipoprotein MlaA